jgi:NAD(P)-dependent dehydrogenase (short-subunit alcohol dehydrogenase family)
MTERASSWWRKMVGYRLFADWRMAMVLEGQVAIVTGGGQGIGRAIALRFAREGAHLAIVDVNRETAEATAREIVALGREAIVGVADVSVRRRRGRG